MNFDRLSAVWPLLRDVMIVTVALGLMIYEAAFYPGPVRETLLLAYTGLLASPVFFRRDEKPKAADVQEIDP